MPGLEFGHVLAVSIKQEGQREAVFLAMTSSAPSDVGCAEWQHSALGLKLRESSTTLETFDSSSPPRRHPATVASPRSLIGLVVSAKTFRINRKSHSPAERRCTGGETMAVLAGAPRNFADDGDAASIVKTRRESAGGAFTVPAAIVA